MSSISVKELSHPAGEVIKIASGKTLDLHSQGTTKMPAGSVLQIVSSIYDGTNDHSTTSTSYVDTQLSVAITPKFTNSKILVQVVMNSATTAATRGESRVLRGAVDLTSNIHLGPNASHVFWGGAAGIWIDSPNTTSSITYKVQSKDISGSTFYYHSGGTISSLVLTEIAQ